MKLRSYFKGYYFHTFLGAFAKLLEAMFELTTPLLMAILIDDGIKMANQGKIVEMSLYILAMTILGYGFSLLCQYLASIVGQGFGGVLRDELFKKIQTFSLEEYKTYSSATLTNRMTSDINQVQWGVAMGIRQATRGPVMLVGTIIMLFFINKTIALVLLASLPVFILVLYFIMRKSTSAHAKTITQNDNILKLTNENLLGSRIIRAFSNEEYEQKRFEKQNEKALKSQNRLAKITSLSNPVTSIIMNVVLTGLIYLAATFVDLGTMKQGQVTAIVQYCLQMLLALIVFMNIVLVYARAFNSSKRLREIFDIKPIITSKKDAQILQSDKPVITFRSVNYSYAGSKVNHVNDVDLNIPFGTRVGIIGLTGSGKTTLLNLIPRYLETNSGEVLIDNKNVKDYELLSLRKNISFVSQTASLINGTIKSNILMGEDYSDEEVHQALKKAEATDVVKSKPLGILEPVLNKGANYSGGQKQRIALARALIQKAPILLLDDTFSALDHLTERRLQKTLKKMGKKTIVVVSQKISSIQESDIILVMDHGEIVISGNHQELLEKSLLYQNIYETQREEE